MNVNGSRFHLLFGRRDWGSCLASDAAGYISGQIISINGAML